MNNSSGEIGFVLGLLAVFKGQAELPWGLIRRIVGGGCASPSAGGERKRLQAGKGLSKGSLGVGQYMHKGSSGGGGCRGCWARTLD